MTYPSGAIRPPRALALLAAAVLLAPWASPTPSHSPSSPAETSAPPSPASSDVPSATPTQEPLPTDEPSASASASPGETPGATPGATAPPGAADVCAGSDKNRAFYAAAPWPWTGRLCPVLPSGWFVDAGTFRLAGGGRMEIAYRGPGGARLEIREGAYCAGETDCIPGTPETGPASFGDRSGRLLDLGDGHWMVVAEGDEVDWEARGTGLDGPTLGGITVAFAKVGE